MKEIKAFVGGQRIGNVVHATRELILLEGTPKAFARAEMMAHMRCATRALSRRLLVWSVISGCFAASAHVRVAPAAEEQATLHVPNGFSRARGGFKRAAVQAEKVTLDEPRLHANAQGHRA